MPFNLFTSNRLENLIELLADSVKRPLSSPFDPETVVVQSRGMQRWISLEIAARQGICANYHFPFPNSFAQEIVSRVLKVDAFTSDIYDPRFLTWTIMKLIPEMISRSAFKQIQNYLREPRGDLKRLQLSERVADLFDQYLLFRPKMVLDWERGKDTNWQAELWRAIVSKNGGRHRADTQVELLKILNSDKLGDVKLPERVSVFGISALPVFHLQLFDALSNYCEVNLYLLNPCREYWGDIKTPKEEQNLVKKVGQFEIDFVATSVQTENQGNSLLASTGKFGRDFFDLIEERFNYNQEEYFVKPEQNVLLGAIQADVLNLRDRVGFDETKIKDEISDRSIQFHSCHNKRREIEVLQNHLLDFFQENQELNPGDILVMAPDIEPYAPYIYASFDLPKNDRKRLPFSVADRSLDQENKIVIGFLAVLNLCHSRFGASEVLNLLELPAIRSKFGISEDRLELIQNWVKESGIRWGRDEADRTKIGMPSISQNTWEFGLERLLLGYAMPGDNKTLFGDILPIDIVEGQETVLLGNFVEFVQRLFGQVKLMSQNHTLQKWRTLFENLLDSLFLADEKSLNQIQVIRRVLAEFSEYETTAGFDEKICLSVAKHYLENKLKQEGFGFGFLTGGITFCSMLPMRSIPAKIICLIGMNNDAYPRGQRPLGFDLMAQNPQKGDRSRRNDDRYLFLETLLSARQKLYISFIGQNIKDNSKIVPSTLVVELQDYIEKNYAHESGEIIENLTIEHKLQAFSPDYFNGSNVDYFSYSHSNCEAAQRAISKKEAGAAEFLVGELPKPDATFREISLDSLVRFFINPAEFFFKVRLGLTFPRDLEISEDKENFELRGLSRYKVADDFLSAFLDKADLETIKTASLHSGVLPLAEVGRHKAEDLALKIEQFNERNNLHIRGGQLADLEVDLEISGFHLTGKLNHIWQNGQMISRYGSMVAKDHLQTWIRHLVLNSLVEGGYPQNSFLTGVEKLQKGNWVGWKFMPVENARTILKTMLELYWQGLHKPLRFFPNTALAYAEVLDNPQKEKKAAFRKALVGWFGSDFGKPGECEDAYFKRLYRLEENSINEEFAELAMRVYKPLLASRGKL